jgi:hypothetical protein
MTSPTLVTARFYEPERRRLEQVVGPVEIAGFGTNGMTMPGAELRRRIRLVERLVLEFEQADEAVLSAGRHLKVVACCRNEPAGSVDIRVAIERRIPVVFTTPRHGLSPANRLVNSQARVDQCVCGHHRRGRLMTPRRSPDDQRRLRVLP